MVNFTRPAVAFSTSLAQPWSTLAVRWCWGDTHDDMVSVVWAWAGATAARAAPRPASAATTRVLRVMVSSDRADGDRLPAGSLSRFPRGGAGGQHRVSRVGQ